jgi:hypothetical protein
MPYSNKHLASPALATCLPCRPLHHGLHPPSRPESSPTSHLGLHCSHFPALGDTSLISIGQLCNASCTATFTTSLVQVHLNDNLLLFEGSHSVSTNHLWRVNLPIQPPQFPQALTVTQGTPALLVAFAQASLFPCPAEIQAIPKVTQTYGRSEDCCIHVH